MNKEKPTTIEEKLTHGRAVRLSDTERDHVWSELQAYTKLHGVPPQNLPEAASRGLRLKFIAAFCSLVLMVSIGIGADSSLPGEFLYPVKVDLIEPTLGFTKISPTAQVEYHTNAIAQRLEEIQELAMTAPLTELQLAQVESEVSEHTTELGELFKTEGLVYEEEVVLTLLTNAVADVRTLEAIEDVSITAIRPEDATDVESRLNILLQIELAEFVTNDPNGAINFSEELLRSLQSEITTYAASTPITKEMQLQLTALEAASAEVDVADILKTASEIHILIDVNNEMIELQTVNPNDPAGKSSGESNVTNEIVSPSSTTSTMTD